MLQLITEILGEKIVLDLYGNEDIFASISIAEIQDISQKNSSYTKDFNLPGSKTNNRVFQHFYNVNSVQTNYDARNKFSAYFTYDGYTIMTGYIRLNSVTQTRTEIFYNVNFYNQIGDLAANISDKFMRELDLSHLSHPYDESLGYNSIPDPDLANSAFFPQPTSGITYWALFNKGYEYKDTGGTETEVTPLLEFDTLTSTGGTFSGQYTPVRYFYFTPTIQVKELYNQIFVQAGYEMDSDFFNTAYFNRFYLPLTYSDSLYPLQATLPQFAFEQPGAFNYSAVTPYFCQNEVCSLSVTGGGYHNLVVPSGVTVDTISATTPQNYFSFQLYEPGYYNCRFSFDTTNTASTDNLMVLYCFRLKQDGALSGWSMAGGTYYVPSATTADTRVTFDFNFDSSTEAETLTNNYALILTSQNPLTGGTRTISNVAFELVPDNKSPRYIDGDFDYNLEFPENEFKQIDFIQSINKLFNLVVVPNIEFPNKLRVEPVIDYFHTGEVLDWTNKVDRNAPIIVTPTTSILKGTVSFNYQDEEDIGNSTFKSLVGRKFGTQTIQLNLDYKDADTPIDTGFSSQVDYVLPTPASYGFPTLPIHYLTVQENINGISTNFFNPYKTNPQLFYRGLLLPSSNLGEFSGTPSTVAWRVESPSAATESLVVEVFPQNNRFNTYPFGLSGFSHYTNFNKLDKYDPRELDFSCYEDMYDIYWKDYILDLSDDESRVLTCSVYLTPFEIQQLDFTEIILIDGNYYRINKISDYSLSRAGLANVQLVKKTRDYTPHRVRYFDLVGCNPVSTIHTSTDENATIYAYVGSYIRVGDECYVVQETTYNPSYTYERVNNYYYFASDTLQPVVFDSCAECQAAANDVYHNVSTPLVIYNETTC